MSIDDVSCSPSRRNAYGTGVRYRILGYGDSPRVSLFGSVELTMK